MITTSATYDDAIQATIRKFRGMVEVTWVDSDIDPTIVVTANDYNRINDAAEVPSGNENLQHAADGKLFPNYKYAHLDQDIVADGTFHPFPGTKLFDYCRNKGYIGKCPGGADFYSTAWSIDTPFISEKRLIEIYDNFVSLVYKG